MFIVKVKLMDKTVKIHVGSVIVVNEMSQYRAVGINRSIARIIRPMRPKEAAPSVIFWTATLALVVATPVIVLKELDACIPASSPEACAQENIVARTNENGDMIEGMERIML